MLCGDQDPVFTREEIMKYTEPKLGYSKESPGFLRFVNVLVEMTGAERKAFLQFTTGCSSLPPGGLANLHPRYFMFQPIHLRQCRSDPSPGAQSRRIIVIFFLVIPFTFPFAD